MNGVHDMGGQHGHGPVVAEKDEPVFHQRWEGRTDAMMRLSLRKGLFHLDEFRRTLERMEPGDYLRSSYYERWLQALESLVREKDGAPRVARSSRPPLRPAYQPGQTVRAKNLNPRGHTRLARYVRGKRGTVERAHGPFLLPDTNSAAGAERWEPVYTVVFDAAELWGEDAEPAERVSIDLWESYLEAMA